MKKIVLFVFLAFVFANLTAGKYEVDKKPFLPKNLTEEEKKFIGTLKINKDTTSPPDGEVFAAAEFDSAEAVIFSWESYSNLLEDLVTSASQSGKVMVVVDGQNEENSVSNQLSSNGAVMSNIDFMHEYLNSVWMRDYGPWWIYKENGERAIVDPIYNRPRPDDDEFPSDLASELGVDAYRPDLIFPGGNLIIDGHGCAIMTDIVFDPSEGNPGMTEEELAELMYDYMGIHKIIILDPMNQDGTGHVDMFCKLLNDTTIIVGEYDSPSSGASGNYTILNNNAALLEGETNGAGQSFNVVRMPMPPYTGTSFSYTNSLIFNKKVLVPIYNHEYDDDALNIYEQWLPGYDVEGFNCNDIITANGAIHCITKLIHPEKGIMISHTELENTENTIENYEIVAGFETENMLTEKKLYWNTEGPGYTYNELDMTEIPVKDMEYFYAEIPAQSSGTDIYYYIYAKDDADFESFLPLNYETEPFSFSVITDSEPPVITHTPVTEYAYQALPIRITCEVTDNLGVDEVVCGFNHNLLEYWEEVVMENTEGNTYVGYINNNFEINDIVHYKITASDISNAGNTSELPESDSYNITIINFPISFYDFEDNDGGFIGENGFEHGSDSYMGAYSGSNVWGTELNSDYNGSTLYSLESTEFIPLNDMMLSFYHRYEMESGYDGGNVKVLNTDTDEKVLIYPENVSYDETISSGYNNPIGGEDGFTGTLSNWSKVEFNLSDFAGENVKIIWEMGTDNMINKKGWYIDDVYFGPYTGIEDNPNDINSKPYIKGIYPNPSNGVSEICFTKGNSKSMDFKVKIYDVQGRFVKEISAFKEDKGLLTMTWDGRNESSSEISAGVYFAVLFSDGKKQDSSKMLIIK